MRFSFLFFLSIYFFCSIVSATEESVNGDAPVNYALGLKVGGAVGNGLMLRSYTDRAFYQLTYSGYVDKVDDEAYFNVSTSYARYLVKAEATTYLLPIGIKWILNGGAIYDRARGRRFNKINVATGFGVDLGSVGKTGLIYSINALYTLSFDGLRSPKLASLSFKPAVGLLYNLK